MLYFQWKPALKGYRITPHPAPCCYMGAVCSIIVTIPFTALGVVSYRMGPIFIAEVLRTLSSTFCPAKYAYLNTFWRKGFFILWVVHYSLVTEHFSTHLVEMCVWNVFLFLLPLFGADRIWDTTRTVLLYVPLTWAALLHYYCVPRVWRLYLRHCGSWHMRLSWWSTGGISLHRCRICPWRSWM